ncbi:MAG TPA: histidine kinase [Pedobacter sp.]|uniref:sensor histidine kinase n=1 Tax=Pedobacter sp. TaxID=1411316 RepID=UPI002B5B038F|nr:histidine kinase [Pedobacter sp.]HMI02371.1 histidine kinase [Pedobacter sp.]
MKKNLWLLLGTFIVFYILVHLSGHLPGLLRGKWTLVDERSLAVQVLSMSTGLSTSFLYVLAIYAMMNKYYPNRKFKRLSLHVGLIISIAFISCFLTSYAATVALSRDPVRLNLFFRNNVLIYILNTIFAMVFYFIRYTRQKELEQKELELQNRSSELSFLRSQVNPHFLFNNLNTIYSLVYHKSEQALPAISGLSELLRYMLYDNSEKIELEQEISYIEKYISLQQLRFENPVAVKMKVTGNVKEMKVPPLLLIPFVENAFKHGDVSESKEWLWIDINMTGTELIFSCVNTKANKHKDFTGGIGIENVRKRLELLFKGRYELDVRDNEDQFTVKLDLNNEEW